MSHHLIIDCFENGAESCQLSDAGEQQIKLQSRILPATYRYYLTINNHSKQACSYFLNFKTNSRNELQKSINLKFTSIKEELFNDSLAKFINEGAILNELSRSRSELYTIDFNLPEDLTAFEFYFDLNLEVDCHEIEKVVVPAGEVLGAKEESSIEAVVFEENQPGFFSSLKNLSQKEWLFALFFFLILLFLVFASGKLLTSSKKGSQ